MRTDNLTDNSINVCVAIPERDIEMLTKKIFTLFDCINRAGLDTGEWGMVEDVDTKNYFGSLEFEILSGRYAYVWLEKDEFELNRELNMIPADIIVHSLQDVDSEIRIYSIE